MHKDKGRKLNWKQACDVIGCGKTYLYNAINSGELPAYRLGKVRGLWIWESDAVTFRESRALAQGEKAI